MLTVWRSAINYEEKIGLVALIVAHTAHSLIANAPRHEDRFKEGTNFDQSAHNWMFDMLILAGLIILSGSEFSYAATEDKGDKAKKTGMRIK